MPHWLKCKMCNAEWHIHSSYSIVGTMCPNCASAIIDCKGLPALKQKVAKVPVVVYPEPEKQSGIHKRFQDII